MSQTDLEKDALEKCNELAKEHGFTVEKMKIKRSIKYCLVMEGFDILCNDSVVGMHKFCQNEKDMALLAQTAPSMILDKKKMAAAS